MAAASASASAAGVHQVNGNGLHHLTLMQRASADAAGLEYAAVALAEDHVDAWRDADEQQPLRSPAHCSKAKRGRASCSSKTGNGREKNRLAQRRFRARQKSMLEQMQTRMDELGKQVSGDTVLSLSRISRRAAGCEADLAADGKYSVKRRLCRQHLTAEWIIRRDCEQQTKWRFCQQCGKLEPLSMFEGDKRSCSMQLARRRHVAAASKRCRDTTSTSSADSGGELLDDQYPTSAGPVQLPQLPRAPLNQLASTQQQYMTMEGPSLSGSGPSATQQFTILHQEMSQAVSLVAVNPGMLSPAAGAQLQMAGGFEQFAGTVPAVGGSPHGSDHGSGEAPGSAVLPGSFPVLNNFPRGMAAAAADGLGPSAMGNPVANVPAHVLSSGGMLDLMRAPAVPAQGDVLPGCRPSVTCVPQQPFQQQLLQQQWQSFQGVEHFHRQFPCPAKTVPAAQAQQAGHNLGAPALLQIPEASTGSGVPPAASTDCSPYPGPGNAAAGDGTGEAVVPVVQFRPMAPSGLPLQSAFASAGTGRMGAAAGPDVFAGAAGGAQGMLQSARLESLQHATRDSFMSILNRLDSRSNALSLMDIQNTFDNLSEVLGAALEEYPALASPMAASVTAGGHDGRQVQQEEHQLRLQATSRSGGSGRIRLELEAAWDGCQ
eukprot:gene2870-3161_t